MLIDFNQKAENKSPDALFLRFDTEQHSVILESAKRLECDLGKLQENQTCIYISPGKVSTYQLLNFFLDKFKSPARVYITTWGMTETALRQLASRKRSGKIEKLYFVFSEQTRVNKANEWQLSHKIADKVKVTPCHAKIYLMLTDQEQVGIISSGNLNRNNKLEAGTITRNKSAIDGIKNFLDSIIFK